MVIEMVRIGWVSRHPILKNELDVLKQKFGDDIEIVQFSQSFNSADDVVKVLRENDIKIAVIVLPINYIIELLKNKDIIFLQAIMQTVHRDNCNGESCKDFNKDSDIILKGENYNRHMRFDCFKKIVKVEVVYENL